MLDTIWAQNENNLAVIVSEVWERSINLVQTALLSKLLREAQTVFDRYMGRASAEAQTELKFVCIASTWKLADNTKNVLRKQFPLFDASGQSTITRCAIWVFTFSELVGEAKDREEERWEEEENQRLETPLEPSIKHFFLCSFFLESFEPTRGMCVRVD